MFDYFRSSYNLGEHFTDVVCQTKDIEDGIGGTLSNYWLDPHGYLYLIDTCGTSDLVILDKDSPEYNDSLQILNFKWVPNGKRGKVRPHMITKYVEIYPENWKGTWEDRPTAKIHFKYGRLVDYEIF